jgi:hypothetical protein
MARAIIEPMAYAARQRAGDEVQVRSQHPTARTRPVGLHAAVDAILADDLEHLWPAVDDDGDRLARDPSVRRGGYPLGGFDEGSVGPLGACAEV